MNLTNKSSEKIKLNLKQCNMQQFRKTNKNIGFFNKCIDSICIDIQKITSSVDASNRDDRYKTKNSTLERNYEKEKLSIKKQNCNFWLFVFDCFTKQQAHRNWTLSWTTYRAFQNVYLIVNKSSKSILSLENKPSEKHAQQQFRSTQTNKKEKAFEPSIHS